MWLQSYDPFGNVVLSTAIAALPIVVLLASIALWHVRIHYAALGSLLVALGLAVGVYRMPADVPSLPLMYSLRASLGAAGAG